MGLNTIKIRNLDLLIKLLCSLTWQDGLTQLIKHSILDAVTESKTAHVSHVEDRELESQPTRRGGQLSRAPASRAGRSRNPKIMGSSPDPVDSISGRVKPMTLKLILVTS